MKKLLLIFVFLIGSSVVLANENFNITMKGPLTEGSVLNIQVNNIDKLKTIDVKIGDIRLPRSGNENNNYKFIIPKNFKINPLDKHIKIDVYKLNNSVEHYLYDKFFPEFVAIDLTDLSGGKQVSLNGHFSGSCNLFYSKDKSWSISVDSKAHKYSVTIPTKIEKSIYGGYVNCDGLSSNYVKFYIPASPKILYIISANKQRIVPGSKVFLVGENIKLKPTDKVKLLLGSDEISFKFISDNKLEFTLPNKNLSNTSVKVIRNGFESNVVNISSISNIFLKQVEIKYC